MKVKSKQQLKGEVYMLGAEVLAQHNNRVAELDLKLHRARNELLKIETDLVNARQARDQVRAYIKQTG